VSNAVKIFGSVTSYGDIYMCVCEREKRGMQAFITNCVEKKSMMDSLPATLRMASSPPG